MIPLAPVQAVQPGLCSFTCSYIAQQRTMTQITGSIQHEATVHDFKARRTLTGLLRWRKRYAGECCTGTGSGGGAGCLTAGSDLTITCLLDSSPLVVVPSSLSVVVRPGHHAPLLSSLLCESAEEQQYRSEAVRQDRLYHNIENLQDLCAIPSTYLRRTERLWADLTSGNRTDL